MTNNPKRGKGKTWLWIIEHSTYRGDECIFWPFNRVRGYGTMMLNGASWRAHRLMCILVNGEAPSRDHEAAHSCGRGHDGCMTPRHLSWKTREQNQIDRKQHGTAAGTWKRTIGRRKLTKEQIDEMRLIGRSKTYDELGAMFDVSPSRAREIILGIRTQL